MTHCLQLYNCIKIASLHGTRAIVEAFGGRWDDVRDGCGLAMRLLVVVMTTSLGFSHLFLLQKSK